MAVKKTNEKWKIGDKAPAFEAFLQNGETISSKSLLGKRYVLYFYPKDNTPGCTLQACNLRDHYRSLEKAGYEVYGVSPDSAKSHQKFIERFELPFSLIADTEKELCVLFGVWVEKSMYGRKYMGVKRSTFVINEKGIIENIIEEVKTSDHAAQLLKS